MLNRVRAQNFLSWKNLDFTFTDGVTLFDGWNEDDQTSEGSGKSTYLNAICYGAYGKIPKQDVNIDDVIKHGEKGCVVVLSFDDGTQIIRSRKPNELLMIDGAGLEIRGKDARETQQLIQDYLGASYEAFLQACYFPQNWNERFITSNQEDRGKLLSEIQELSVFDLATKETQGLLKLEDANLVKFQHQLSFTEQKINSTRNEIQMIRNFIQETDARHEKYKMSELNKINSGKARLEKMELDLSDLQSKLEKTDTSEVTEVMERLKTEKDQVFQKQQEVNFLVRKQNDTQNALKRLDRELSSLQPKQVKVETEIQQLREFILNPSYQCPTCNSVLQTLDLSHVNAEIIEKEADLASLLVDQGELAHRRGVLVDELYTATNPADHSEELIQLETNIRALKNVLAEADRVQDQAKFLEGQIKAMAKELQILESEYQHLGEPDVHEHLKTIEVLSISLTENLESQASITQLVQTSSVYRGRLEVLKNGFKEIKAHVFQGALDELTERANAYLSRLFEVPARIEFENRDMKISSSIYLNGIARGLGLLSGGQFRRFSLAVDLALSDMVLLRKSCKINLLALDEYFQGLSEGSMEKCLDLLRERKSPVLLIEHNSIFKNVVDHICFVRLKNGTSVESEPS